MLNASLEVCQQPEGSRSPNRALTISFIKTEGLKPNLCSKEDVSVSQKQTRERSLIAEGSASYSTFGSSQVSL